MEVYFNMLSDIEIALAANMLPIKEIANQLGIDEDDVDFYGKYKCKLNQLNNKEYGNTFSKVH